MRNAQVERLSNEVTFAQALGLVREAFRRERGDEALTIVELVAMNLLAGRTMTPAQAEQFKRRELPLLHVSDDKFAASILAAMAIFLKQIATP